jgi:hypothetical protein
MQSDEETRGNNKTQCDVAFFLEESSAATSNNTSHNGSSLASAMQKRGCGHALVETNT